MNDAMSIAGTADLALPRATASESIRPGWIQSPAFDLACFTLSPLAGLAIIVAAIVHPLGAVVGIAASFLLGVPHYLATFTFYGGDDNRAYYRSRPVAFIGIPVLVFGTVLGLRSMGLDSPVLITMFVWNIWHVSLQSAGILSIYRRLHRGPDSERAIAKLALVSTGAAMALWQPTTFPPLHEALESISIGLYGSISITFAFTAAISLLVLAVRIVRRPRRIQYGEAGFLISSVFLFHPFLWVRDGQQATLAMLAGHFIQYLAIVWLLNGRRFQGAPGSRVQQLLGSIGSNPRYVVAWMIGTGVTVWALSRASAGIGLPMAFVVGMNSLALIHFYLDGRFWSFRDPFVRRTMAPILVPDSRRAGG